MLCTDLVHTVRLCYLSGYVHMHALRATIRPPRLQYFDLHAGHPTLPAIPCVIVAPGAVVCACKVGMVCASVCVAHDHLAVVR